MRALSRGKLSYNDTTLMQLVPPTLEIGAEYSHKACCDVVHDMLTSLN